MMNGKEMMGKMMGDDEMLAVVGGRGDKWVENGKVNGLYRKSAWGTVCDKYECGCLCGGKGRSLDVHAAGCSVKALLDPNATAEKLNGCWSCKHSKYGAGYPHDESDVWCPYE